MVYITVFSLLSFMLKRKMDWKYIMEWASCYYPLYLMQKQYAALVWIDRPLKDEDMQAISSLKDKVSSVRFT